MNRQCSRPACSAHSEATLTYDYAERLVTLGHLSDQAHPMTYDLCAMHADGLTVPRGWELHDRRVVRVASFGEPRSSIAS